MKEQVISANQVSYRRNDVENLISIKTKFGSDILIVFNFNICNNPIS